MKRPIDVHHPVHGDLDRLQGLFVADPSVWLPPPARWRGRDQWAVRLSAGRLSHVVTCHVGAPWHMGGERWRHVSWEPLEGPDHALPVRRALPTFSGELGLLAGQEGGALVLRGTYEPPAGALGAAADAAALGRVAGATARRFLGQVAAVLERVTAG